MILSVILLVIEMVAAISEPSSIDDANCLGKIKKLKITQVFVRKIKFGVKKIDCRRLNVCAEMTSI